MRNYKIATIAADGVEPVVIECGVRALHALAQRDRGLELAIIAIDWGATHYRHHGEMMPKDGLSQFKTFDAIYCGAAEAIEAPDCASPGPDRRGFDRHDKAEAPALLAASLAGTMVRQPPEPVYAFAGDGFANPIGALWTAAQMLEDLGEHDAAFRLMVSIEQVCDNGILTPDAGGTASTSQVCDAVVAAILGQGAHIALNH